MTEPITAPPAGVTPPATANRVRYLNRVIHLGFPELGGCADETDETTRRNTAYIWLKVRNPRLMAGGELTGVAGTVTKNPDGSVTMNDAASEAAFEGMAKLIIAGVVPDPADDDEYPALLPMPPAGNDMGRFPLE